MTGSEATQPRLEPGSFRDPDSRILRCDGRVLRLLSAQGLADWETLSPSSLSRDLVREGKLVDTREVHDFDAPPDALTGEVAAVLEHDVVPFVSYPYEWTFGMLRDAALLQLELVRRAIGEGMMLKDSSPYNVQFRGSRPVFIDLGSFERLREGEPWAGYRQFCMLFLYPLFLQAWKGIPFQPWLRGRIGGITPEECRAVLSWHDILRRGALTHVALHARLERRHQESDADIKGELKAAGFRKELIVANVTSLERLVSRLRWRPRSTAWSGYEPTTTYSEADAGLKAEFVARAVATEHPRLVWDLGCNDGHYSRIAAKTADYVVAVDADPVTVEALYESLKAEDATTILPLTMDLTDPSPGLGWNGVERQALLARGRPDLALCLALVHHLSISGNVPVAELVDWLHGLGAALVIEFPTREDPMVRRLLVRKRPGDHPDYRREWFERCLGERFVVQRSEVLSSGTRILYHARPNA